jgi:plastocyanin
MIARTLHGSPKASLKPLSVLIPLLLSAALAACSSEPPPEAPLVQLRRLATDVVAHAQEFKGALDRGNLETAKRHAEHLVNLIEGTTGEHYGDLDEDGTVEDPGDGNGLINYVADVEAAVGAERHTALTNLTVAQLRRILRDSLLVIDASDLSTVQALERAASEAQQMLDSIVRLEDTSEREGVVAMAAPEATVPAPSTASQTVTVFMDKFQLMEQNVTVQAGWTVVWVNKESPKHTATGDNGGFTSGTLARGDSFSFTFAESGTFPYYCRFHGDKGGLGMAGVIVVE